MGAINGTVSTPKMAGVRDLYTGDSAATVLAKTNTLLAALKAAGLMGLKDQYAQAALKLGPYLYYRLGEPSGVTADNAEGTAARDGTYVRAPTLAVAGLVSGDPGTAVTFNGLASGGNSVLGPTIPAMNDWTVAFIVKTNGTPDNYSLFFGTPGDNMDIAYHLGQFMVYGGGGWTTTTIRADDSVTKRLVFAYTSTGDVLTVYESGVVKYSGNEGRALSNSAPSIGGKADGTGSVLGTMQEFLLLNRCITPAEVALLEAAATP